MRKFFSATMLAATLSVCFAQEAPSPWTVVTTVRVKPDMRTEFEALQKQVSAAYKKAGVPWRAVMQTWSGDTGEYTSVSPVMKVGDMATSPLVKALGEEGSQKMIAALSRCYVSQTRMLHRPDAALRIDKAAGKMEPFMMWTTVNLAPGKGADYAAWLKNEYLPALEKAGVKWFIVERPTFGGPGNTMVQVRMMNGGLAEIDGGPILNKAMKPEEARAMNAKTDSMVRGRVNKIVRIRPELSHLPAPASSGGN